ncbi:MAG: tyrosine-type recombinase/integrase [Acidimicrobiia bacterium]
MAVSRRATKAGEVRYDVRLRGPDGREVSRTFRTVKDAERFQREQLRNRDRGEWVDPAAGRVTLADWVADWQRTIVHLRPSTKRIYGDALRLHVLPTLGATPLGKLTTPQLRAWLSELSSAPSARRPALAPASVHQVYRTLNRVLNAAVRDGIMGRNPLAGVDPPKVEREEMRVLSPAQVNDLAATIDPRYRAFVIVGAYCGLRLGELAALRWSRVDFLRRSISVVEQLDQDGSSIADLVTRPPKSNAGRRHVPMPRLVVAALEQHRDAGYGEPAADGYVFVRPAGGPLDVDKFRASIWRPACRQAGVDDLRIHDLRHTCASLAISAGADVKVLQRMLGHASAAMTLDRYGHLMPGQAEAVADRLDDLAERAGRTVDAQVIRLDGTVG